MFKEVYIVKGHYDYEGYSIVGVFDSMDKAIEVKANNIDQYDNVSIDEYKVQ